MSRWAPTGVCGSPPALTCLWSAVACGPAVARLLSHRLEASRSGPGLRSGRVGWFRFVRWCASGVLWSSGEDVEKEGGHDGDSCPHGLLPAVDERFLDCADQRLRVRSGLVRDVEGV